MYIFLSRAFKNVGDFLIAERGKELLKHLKPDHELIEFNSSTPLDDKINLLNEADLLIINGVPGYQPNMYPEIYPLVKDLSSLETPIAILGGGWRAFPGDTISVKNFSFNSASRELLQFINKNDYLSCRDYLTKDVLNKSGFSPVTMTGGPAWYDLDYLNKDMFTPYTIEKLVFTPPANMFYFHQSIQVMNVLNKLFPTAKKFCSFHRGIKADEYTSKHKALFYKKLAKKAKNRGYLIKDTSYDTSKLAFYDDCDLHVGYRVHGHLYFLSHRLPSVLIEEDGRGRGANEALSLIRVKGWQRRMKNKLIDQLMNHFTISDVLSKIDIITKPTVKSNKYVPRIVEQYLKEEIDNNFQGIKQSVNIIDSTFEKMKKFVKKFPK